MGWVMLMTRKPKLEEKIVWEINSFGKGVLPLLPPRHNGLEKLKVKREFRNHPEYKRPDESPEKYFERIVESGTIKRYNTKRGDFISISINETSLLFIIHEEKLEKPKTEVMSSSGIYPIAIMDFRPRKFTLIYDLWYEKGNLPLKRGRAIQKPYKFDVVS